MAGLIDTIRRAVTPDTVDSLAGHLGESPQNTGNALSSLIPVILAAMAGRVESGNGGSIVDLVKSTLSSGNPFDTQSRVAEAPIPGIAPEDGRLASGLLGPSFGTIASSLADRFGLKADSIKALLSVAGLFGAGGVARALNGNVTQQGLADLFRRERPSIDAALPAGIGSMLGGFGDTTRAAGATAARAAEETAGGLGRLWPWLLVALAVLALIFGLRSCNKDEAVTTTTTTTQTTGEVIDNNVDMTTAAPTTPAPAAAVPVGSGVVNEMREGRPALVVYFDTAKSEVSKDLSTASADVKRYLDAHPQATLAVSGFNDPTGDAAANAALSKRRAEEVSKALAATGIPAAAIKMEKPADTTGTGGTNAQSRRVEVTVRD